MQQNRSWTPTVAPARGSVYTWNVISVRQIPILLAVALVLSACASSKTPVVMSEMSEEVVAQHLDLRDASWGYHVVDIETGAEVTSRLPDIGQPPASTAKILTMIGALGVLGSEYKFETTLLTNGKIAGETLRGDLVLRGAGDPLLRTNGLKKLAFRLRNLGIRRIDGDFTFESTLPTFPHVNENQPETAPYNQGFGGLNLNFNRIKISGKLDGTYFLSPEEAAGLTPEVTHVLAGGFIDFPLKNPALLVARMFRKFAAQEGIDLPNPIVSQPTSNLVPLTSLQSLPLAEIVRAGLEYSNNMVAEVVGLASSSALGAGPTTLQDSAKALTVWMRENITKGERFAPFLLNHSGLSAASRVTPRDMTTLLRAAFFINFGNIRFDAVLVPAGGPEGYRGRLREPMTAYRIWGKTGSMRFIKGLAGYLYTATGRALAFAIFTNDLHQRSQMKTGTLRDDEKWRIRAGAWRDRAEAFEVEMIRRWISQH